MIINRMRSSANGAVDSESLKAIADVEQRASDEYVAYVQEMGELAVNGQVAQIISPEELDADMRPYVKGPSYISRRETANGTRTLAIDLVAKRGVQRELHGSHRPEYYELDETYWRYLGSPLLNEIFQPGSHTELSELAAAQRQALVDPGEMNVRIMTAADHRKSEAVAVLGKLTQSQLTHVLEIYSAVAYPDLQKPPARPSELERVYTDLKTGKSIGLRTGTQHLACAKHELQADMHQDQFRTWMYLNYDIPFGPVKLHFNMILIGRSSLGSGLQSTSGKREYRKPSSASSYISAPKTLRSSGAAVRLS